MCNPDKHPYGPEVIKLDERDCPHPLLCATEYLEEEIQKNAIRQQFEYACADCAQEFFFGSKIPGVSLRARQHLMKGSPRPLNEDPVARAARLAARIPPMTRTEARRYMHYIR
jgi:hypothetical protein